MSARMIVDLPDGNILLFGGFPEPDAPDAGRSDSFSRATSETFNAALGSIGNIVKALEASIDAMPKRPEKIEIEFGASLSRDGDLWIVSSDDAPEFKIRLAWGKGE
jgi:hypothetical protein